jgi:hypothetical protein
MKTKIAVSALAFSVIGLGIAYAAGLFSEDPALIEIQELQKTIQNDFAKQADGDNSNRDDRREKFRELRKKSEALPEDQQRAIRKEMQGFFVAQMTQRMDEFFELPPEERESHLDEQIDRMEERKARREEAAAKREAEASKDGEAGDTAGNSASSGDGRQRRRGGFGNRSKEERERWQRDMLERTTPAQRAKFMEYRRQLNERREERGLPPARGFGR